MDKLTNLERRLKLIREDLNKLTNLLNEADFDTGETGFIDSDGQWVGVYISNIEIACDLEDKESDNWLLKEDLTKN